MNFFSNGTKNFEIKLSPSSKGKSTPPRVSGFKFPFLIFAFSVFWVPKIVFGAVHSVQDISEKNDGDFLLASDINSILKTISGIFFDDASEILEVAGTVKATDFIKSDGTGIGGASFENVFESGQNVGIGTTNPLKKLDIAGDIQFNYNSLIAGFNSSLDSNYDHIWVNDGDQVYGGNAIGNWVFAHDSRYKAAGNSALVAGNVWMRGSTFDNYFAGNVGIGTNNPASKLEVNGDIKANNFLKSDGQPVIISNENDKDVRLCAGHTPIGSSDWQPYNSDNGEIYIDVDTSHCNFTQTPIYISNLAGDSWNWRATGGSSPYFRTKNSFRIYLDFTGLNEHRALSKSFANDQDWHITWMAVGR